MKAVMLVLTAAFTPWIAPAQGQFEFGNRNFVARVSLPNGAFATGTDFWAQAYVKRAGDPDSRYAPVGTPVNLRTGNHAGYILAQAVTTLFPGGTEISVEMRAWAAAWGDSYEESGQNGVRGDLWACLGGASPVLLTVTDSRSSATSDTACVVVGYPFTPRTRAPHSSAVTAGPEPGGVARLVQFTRGQGERLKRRVHLSRGEAAPVQLEEQHRRGEGRPLVAVHERMVAHQSERIGGGQLEQIRLAVGEELPGSGQRGIEQGRVAQPPPTAELGEQPLLQRQNRLPKDPVRFPHFASARRVFRYRRMTPSAASICRTNCSCPSVTGVRRMVPSGASVRQRESPAATFSLAIASFGSTTPTELPTLRSLSSNTMSRC